MAIDVEMEQIQLAHEDCRRRIESLHMGSDGRLTNIVGGEVAIFTIKDPSLVLGNHYHDYVEFLACLSGKGKLTLEDIHTNKREYFAFEKRNEIYIPKEMGIALQAEAGTQILAIREQEISNDTTHPYDMGMR